MKYGNHNKSLGDKNIYIHRHSRFKDGFRRSLSTELFEFLSSMLNLLETVGGAVFSLFHNFRWTNREEGSLEDFGSDPVVLHLDDLFISIRDFSDRYRVSLFNDDAFNLQIAYIEDGDPRKLRSLRGFILEHRKVSLVFQ